MALGTYISIIIFNVNGLNAPNKRHRLAERIPKKTKNKQANPYIRCLKKPISDLKTHIDWKWEDGKTGKQIGKKKKAIGKQKKAGVTILSEKIDLKIKNILRDKEGQ